jgi:hypothetical protein
MQLGSMHPEMPIGGIAMNSHVEIEIGQKILDELISDVEASIQQFRRTLEGLQERIQAEERQRELLQQKRDALHVRHIEDTSTVADFIAKVLLERGEPMRVPEIVNALVENGVYSDAGSARTNSVLSALTRRDDLFERVSRGQYAIKEQLVRRRPHRMSLRTMELANS